MAKPGPKNKIGEAERKQVIAVVKVGGSLADAAGVVGCTRQTLRNAMNANPEFLSGVMQAQKAGKMRLVKRVGTAKAWQAAAWMLERKYGREYGRKERLEHTGPNGGPIRTAATEVVSLRDLTPDELDQLERIAIAAQRRAGRPVEPCRN